MQKTLAALLLVLVTSCTTHRSDQFGSEDLEGTWLFINTTSRNVPQDKRPLYRKFNDSMKFELALRLIRFDDDGKFVNLENEPTTPGSWRMAGENLFTINNGGGQLNEFTGRIDQYKNRILYVSTDVRIDNTLLPIQWLLKRIDRSETQQLFDADNTWWRQKPAAAENEESLRKRVKAMLSFGSNYFNEVGKSATYFVPKRLPLPFRYYQSGIALLSFNDTLPFNNYFHNLQDARQAHHLLRTGMDAIKAQYPSDENFVLEYAKFYKLLNSAL